MPSLSVVIPAYNEEAALGEVLRRCMEVLPLCTDDFEIVVVNDGSTDRTRAIIDQWSARFPGVLRGVHHGVRRGMAQTFEAAYRAGIKEYVMLLHGDGQYPPDILLQCAPLLPANAMVLMTRRRKFYGPLRMLLSWGFRSIPRLLFSLDLRDPGCSKCIRRDLIAATPLLSASIFSEVERVIRLHRAGYGIAFVDIESRPRIGGVAQGGTLRQSVEALRDMLRVWWRLRIIHEAS